MIQLTPQMRILVSVEPADFRCGIDGLAKLCREWLESDPFSGALFVFRNRRATSVKVLAYDGTGFWLMQKRLSSQRFRWWPTSPMASSKALEAHELMVLLAGGDPLSAKALPPWRPVNVAR